MLAYERRHGAERLIIALNLGGRPDRLELPDWVSNWRTILSTVAEVAVAEDGALLLQANEGIIISVD